MPSKMIIPLIAHAWADYVPATFIEPHVYLLEDPRFESINLVMNLWDNGKAVDNVTHYQRDMDAKNLVNPSLLHRIVRRATRRFRWFRFEKMCTRSIDRFNISLVHSHFATTACEISTAINEKSIPHIVTLYGYDGSAALKDEATIKKYKKMFTCVDHIIVLSNIVKQRLIDHGCDSNLITVWNMPAGVENFPYRFKRPKDTIRLLMAARFTESKGHIYALESLKKLIHKGYSVRLTMIGYGNEFAKLEDLIHNMKLRPYVSILDNKLMGDFSTDFQSHLNEHDIYLAPSIQDRHGTDEGGPSLTAVCAQAAGLPVISTPFPGSEVSIIDGITGLICKERNSDSLAEKIETLILNKDLAASIGKAGSLLVNREFSQSGQMEKLLSIYDSCLGIKREKTNQLGNENRPNENTESAVLAFRRVEH